MLFDVDIIEMLESGKMKIRDNFDQTLSLDFMKSLDMIQPGSIDVRLNTMFAFHKSNKFCYEFDDFSGLGVSKTEVDPLEITQDDYEMMEVNIGEKVVLPPLSFCLAGTIEAT